MANTKPLVIEVTASGCHISTSHKLTKDGYLRKRVWVFGKLVNRLYHRHMWSLKHGEMPKGYEIDHMCKNRACFNVEHLQMLTSSVHRTKDNTGRNSDRKELAHKHWLLHHNTGTSLSKIFGVPESAACKWIREWKQYKLN